jgi:hypothetical protein
LIYTSRFRCNILEIISIIAIKPEIITIPIADNANQEGIIMWLSHGTAAKLYDIANIFLIIGLVIGIVSTVFVVWMGNIKEEYLRRDLKDKDVEIARLHKAVRPRMLDRKIFLEDLKGKPKAKVEILYKPGDDEAWGLALQIGWGLSGAGWEVVEPRPLTEADIPEGPMNKPTVPLTSRPSVILNPGLVLVANRIPENPFGDEGKNNPALALNLALMKAGAGGGQINLDPKLPDGLIKVIIGQKN